MALHKLGTENCKSIIETKQNKTKQNIQDLHKSSTKKSTATMHRETIFTSRTKRSIAPNYRLYTDQVPRTALLKPSNKKTLQTKQKTPHRSSTKKVHQKLAHCLIPYTNQAGKCNKKTNQQPKEEPRKSCKRLSNTKHQSSHKASTHNFKKHKETEAMP